MVSSVQSNSVLTNIRTTLKTLYLCEHVIIYMDKLHGIMKLKKRKIKFASVFFICWFALCVLMVDGVFGFQTLLDKVGSYAILESALILLVLIPTVIVYIMTKEAK